MKQNATATVYEKKDGEWKVIATSAVAIHDKQLFSKYRISYDQFYKLC